MRLIVDKPQNIPKEFFPQLIELIRSGKQVKPGFEKRLQNSEKIAFLLDDDLITTTLTIKNPEVHYRNGVFTEAGVPEIKATYDKELGYIVTHPDYRSRALCSKLLHDTMIYWKFFKLFATTRNLSMGRILEQFSFRRVGNTYNGDLDLFVLSDD